MKNLTPIKSLAFTFLSTESKELKKAVLADVKSYLEGLKFKSCAKLKRELGLSYFLGLNSSSKIEKGLKENIDTLVLYLSASDNAGFEICPYKTVECALACLVESGRAAMESKQGNIHISRLVKTWLVKFRKDLALELIQADINRAVKKGRKFAVRLNGTSDLNWKWIINRFPAVQFYDYTKGLNRVLKAEHNEHITFSFSGYNHSDCFQAVRMKANIAIPVTKEDFEAALKLPNTFNGDTTDLRYKDEQKGQLCLLKVKGNNVKKSAFIMNFEEVEKMSQEITERNK
jgi:uncharacterized protein YehS (DUF1456 family)